MARHEQPREDLLREATALGERIELYLPGNERTVVIGFRSNNAASIFFEDQPVYHFNAGGELRRAFLNDELLKADRRRLIRLIRKRLDDRVLLQRRPLNSAETQEFLEATQHNLTELRDELQAGRYQIRGQVPEETDVLAKSRQWLIDVTATPLRVAQAPNVEG